MPKTVKPLADIACIMRVGDAVPQTALQQAIALASANGAHLTVKISVQQLSAPYSPFWISLPVDLVGELNTRAKTSADQAADVVRTATQVAGVNADVATIMDKSGDAAAQATHAARASDLIVVDQPDAVMDSRAIVFEAALFHSGRPVLVATGKRPPITGVTKAAIAWDGSSHVARATAELFALFPTVSEVDIIVVQGEKDLSRSLPGADLARHLSRKGVTTNLVELSARGGPVWKLLDEQATRGGADVLVMGGYGHSRFREFVLGGVTESIVRQASVPLLMSW